jgi:hypothetical protein
MPEVVMGQIVDLPPSLILPFWFKQRQCKVETRADTSMLEVSGPNLPKAYLTISPSDANVWRATLRTTPDGADVATADASVPMAKAAWEAAFELYRIHFIV